MHDLDTALSWAKSRQALFQTQMASCVCELSCAPTACSCWCAPCFVRKAAFWYGQAWHLSQVRDGRHVKNTPLVLHPRSLYPAHRLVWVDLDPNRIS